MMINSGNNRIGGVGGAIIIFVNSVRQLQILLVCFCCSVSLTHEWKSFNLRQTNKNDVLNRISEIHTKDYGEYRGFD